MTVLNLLAKFILYTKWGKYGMFGAKIVVFEVFSIFSEIVPDTRSGSELADTRSGSELALNNQIVRIWTSEVFC